MQFHETLPLSLYIHLPWCVKKCPYCDFNSHAKNGTIPEADYVAALVRDLESELPRIWGRRVSSIFIGGGTPSLFSGAAINELLCALHARLNFNPDIEITLEANPGTVDSEHFQAYRAAGVNRLSIGVQSFSNDRLTIVTTDNTPMTFELPGESTIERLMAITRDDLNIGDWINGGAIEHAETILALVGLVLISDPVLQTP